MKLRIQENVLRFRLTQNEVAQLRDQGSVESSSKIAPGPPLVYRLEGSFHARWVRANFDGHLIRVMVPADMVIAWAESDQVSIEAPSQAGGQLLIEKDFQCLHKSADRGPGAYPNPLAAMEGGLEPARDLTPALR
jgi:hypothetical protein